MERMRRSRRALFAGVLAVAGLQAYLDIGIDGGRLDWADAEYGTTLRHLEQRKREYPNRPVVVMLGTSRSKTAFAADRLSEAVPGDENPPLVLNASVYSAHPFHFQLVLRRLIATGAKPDAVFVEIFPLYMSDTSAIYAADPGRVAIPHKATELHRLRGADLDLIWKHDPDRAALWTRRWCESRLVPVSEHRNILIQRYAETWAMPDVAGSPKYWRAAMSPFGWAQPRVRSLPEGAGAGAEAATEQAYRPHTAFTEVNRTYDVLLRDLLDFCAKEQVEVLGLVIMPESRTFRSWYPENTTVLIRNYTRELATEYGTRMIDAGDWLPDSQFLDHHHVMDPGAEQFSDRLRAEYIRPWMRNRSGR